MVKKYHHNLEGGIDVLKTRFLPEGQGPPFPSPVYGTDRQTQVGTEDLPFIPLALRLWSISKPKAK